MESGTGTLMFLPTAFSYENAMYLRRTFKEQENPGCFVEKKYRRHGLENDLLRLVALFWWAQLDLNQRPPPYQGGALTN